MLCKFFYPVIWILLIIMQRSILSGNGRRKNDHITQVTKRRDKFFCVFRLYMFGHFKRCYQVKSSVYAETIIQVGRNKIIFINDQIFRPDIITINT